MKNIIAYAVLAALVLLAVVGKSAVMAVSVLGMGTMFCPTRSFTPSKQLLAAASGALLASLSAEAVHTVYHMVTSQADAGGDNGFFFFFLSPALVGLINAAVFTSVVLVVAWLTKSGVGQQAAQLASVDPSVQSVSPEAGG